MIRKINWKTLFTISTTILLLITAVLVNANQGSIRSSRLRQLIKIKETYLINQISNNAKWVIDNNDPASITIYSLDFPFLQETFNLEKDGIDSYHSIWSPDSKAILLIYNHRDCMTANFVILQRSAGKWHIAGTNIEQVEYNPEDTCYVYKWSTDSQNIAIFPDFENFEDGLFQPGNLFPIRIVDQNANLTQSLNYQPPISYLKQFPKGMNIRVNWVDDLFIIAKTNAVIPPTNIVILSEQNPELSQKTIVLDGVYQFAGINHEKTQLLLTSFYYAGNSEYLIVDIESGEILQRDIIAPNMYAGFIHPEISTDNTYSAFIAYLTDKENGKLERCLLIWNWKNRSFTNYGPTYGLIKWDEKKESYWIISHQSENDEYEIESVKPN